MPIRKVCSPRKEENDPLGGNAPDPIKVYSDKDLTREFDQVIRDLRNKDHDAWLKRNAALRSIQALILGGAPDLESFLPLIKDARDAIADALGDLRSVLVKEACTTVALLSEVLGDSMVPLAEIFLPVLIKQLGVTIQVISEASHHCLRAIITHTHGSRIIPKILEGAKAKPNAVRSRSIECVLLILQCWSVAEMEKQADAMESAIVSALGDALSDVRATARQCVMFFCERFEERGKKLMSGLDVSTQKKILHEGNLDAHRRENPLAANTCNIPLVSDIKSVKSKATVAVVIAPSVGDKSSLGSKRLSLTSAGRVESKEPRMDEAEAQHPPALSRGAKRVKGPPSPSASARQPSLENCDGVGGQGQVGKACSAPRRATLERVERKGNECTTEQAHPGARDDGLGADECSSARPVARRVQAKCAMAAEQEQVLDVAALLDKANNPLWSLREAALDELRLALENATPTSNAAGQLSKILDVGQLGKVADMLGERLGDGHYRVQLAALGGVSCIAHCASASLTPHLDPLIPRITQRLCDKRDAVRGATRELMDTLLSVYGLEYMVPALIKSLEGPQGLARTSTLDLLMGQLPGLVAFLQSNPAHARALCHRLWHMAVDKALDVRKASAQALAHLRSKGVGACVYETASKLPPDTQAAVRKAIAPHVPEFDAELAAFIRSKKLPSHLVLAAPAVASCEEGALVGALDQHGASPSPPASRSCEPAPSADDYDQWLQALPQSAPSSPRAPHHKNHAPSTPPDALSAELDKRSRGALAQQRVSEDRPGARRSGEGDARVQSVGVKVRGDESGQSDERQAAPAAVPQLAPSAPPPKTLTNGQALGAALAAEQTPGEEGLAQLVRRVMGGDAQQCQSALRRLVELAREGDEEAWSEWAGEVAVACVEALRRPVESGTHQPAMACIAAMCARLTRLCQPLAPLLLDALLATAHLGRRALAAAAEGAGAAMLASLHPRQRVEMLAAVLRKAQAPVLQAALRLVPRLAPALDADVLSGGVELEALVAAVLPHMQHPNADVRKAVVFALVALSQALGDVVAPLLAPLTPSQHKLVTIYLHRLSPDLPQ